MDRLILDPKIHTALGYILYSRGVMVTMQEAAAIQFLEFAPQYTKNIEHRYGARFNVYYLVAPKIWSAVRENFSTFVEAVPYLQKGVRVLIEYDNTIEPKPWITKTWQN